VSTDFLVSRGSVATTHFSQPASVGLPGPRNRTSGASGLQLTRVHSTCVVEAARGCSPSSTHIITTIKENVS
jgi:hypothetical protein